MKKYIFTGKRTLQKTLFTLMLLLILITTSFVYIVNHISMNDFLTDYLNVYTSQIVTSVKGQFNTAISEVSSFVLRVANSQQLVQFVKSDREMHSPEEENTYQNFYQKRTQLYKIITELLPNWDFVTFLGVEYPEKKYYFGSVGNPEIYQDITEKVRPQIDRLYNGEETTDAVTVQLVRQKLVTIVHPIYDFDTKELVFVLVLGINIKKFNLSLIDNNMEELGHICIVDSSGKTIYPMQSEQELDIEDLFENDNDLVYLLSEHNEKIIKWKNNLVMPVKSNFLDWYIVGYVPLGETTKTMDQRQMILVISALIAIAAALIGCVMICRLITPPFHRIVEGMREIEKNNYHTIMMEDTFYEAKYISEQFNHMCRYLNKLINDVYISQIKEKEAQFLALQAQINPHFLYNTLDNLNMMLIMKGEDELSDYVMNLSDLFRYSLDKGQHRVTIKEEFIQTEKYLSIQKIRFGNRLDYHLECEPEIQEKSVIRLILQPIVENAVIHGIEPVPEGGSISVKGIRKENAICIYVSDNGRGIELEEMNHILENSDQTDRESIGLHNVHSRIQHFYGTEYGIRFLEQDTGTTVEIRLPYQAEG